MGKIVLVTGGARSGKSTFAEKLALSWTQDGVASSSTFAPTKRVYIATAQAFDDEMRARIKAHQDRRKDAFTTIEEPIELGSAINQALSQLNNSGVILVDCLTIWTSNLLYYNRQEELEKLYNAITTLKATDCNLILVTNETGLGIVPDNELSRRFRDLAGIINQKVAALATNVVFTVCGIPMYLKGEALC